MEGWGEDNKEEESKGVDRTMLEEKEVIVIMTLTDKHQSPED